MKRSSMTGLFLCVVLGVPTGCKAPPPPPQPQMKVPGPTPLAVQKAELGKRTWNPEWDLIIEKALPPAMLSNNVARAVRPYCPRFTYMNEADKRAFWAYLFQALAGSEAALEPTMNVRHTEPHVAVVDAVTKRTVRSEGLLQLTYMDADRYGCQFDWAADKQLPEKDPKRTILRPENNLTCGVNILSDQLIVKREPLLSRSSYWSTLQPGTMSHRVFTKQMANVPSACRVAPPINRAQSSSSKATTQSAPAKSSVSAVK